MRDYNKTTTSITIALNAQIEKNNENKQKEEEEFYASHGSNSVYHHIKHKVCSLVFVCLLLFINHNDDDDLILVFGLFLFLSLFLFLFFFFFGFCLSILAPVFTGQGQQFLRETR